ncbi:translation elongation factor Ts [Bacteroidota bacterium]
MIKITAAEVNNLRKITGAGMMDCKKALQESEGDVEKAIDILRKKGQKVASKRADKEAKEGVVIALANEDNSFAAVVMVNCETDFVAKNEDFVSFVRSIAQKAIDEKPKSIDELKALDLNGRTVEENLSDQLGKIGEKIEIGGYEFIDAPASVAYIHMGNKLATIVGLNMNDIEDAANIGKDIAMQVAAMNPVALDKESVPQEVIDKEIEIGKDQARQEGKPEEMLEKISMGKLNKFFKENTLLNQEFIKASKTPVRDYLKGKHPELTVTEFKRLMLG